MDAGSLSRGHSGRTRSRRLWRGNVPISPGSYIGYKLMPETIETASSVDADYRRLVNRTIPEFDFPPDGVNAHATPTAYLRHMKNGHCALQNCPLQ